MRALAALSPPSQTAAFPLDHLAPQRSLQSAQLRQTSLRQRYQPSASLHGVLCWCKPRGRRGQDIVIPRGPDNGCQDIVIESVVTCLFVDDCQSVGATSSKVRNHVQQASRPVWNGIAVDKPAGVMGADRHPIFSHFLAKMAKTKGSVAWAVSGTILCYY